MRHKLYETNSYCREHDTQVADAWEENGKHFVILEETIFFPEEGGQYADTGCFILEQGDTVQVLDGKLQADKVVHEVDGEVKVGERVHCVLDWDKRYMRMQNHSGEHILTGAIHNRYGYDNVGFHLSDDGEVTMDMSGVLTPEQAMEMETVANELIYKNLPIVDLYPDKGTLAQMEYRSKIEIEGQVRLIQIGDKEEMHDLCACCAPHVARTGEVGLIRITSLTNYKGGVRIGILCGMRGFDYAREQSRMLGRVAGMLSTKPEQVFSIVENMKKETAALRQKVTELTDEIVRGKMDSLSEPILFLPEDVTAVTMKNAFNDMAEKFSGYTGVFVGTDETGYRYYAGSRDLDARELAAIMREKLGAKGGGNQDMIQGKVERTAEEIRGVFE